MNLKTLGVSVGDFTPYPTAKSAKLRAIRDFQFSSVLLE